ncbi:MAG TPA: SDR family NAD(P)-dependent oxidoreductase, partial [Candidatus Acidoferrum sp.]
GYVVIANINSDSQAVIGGASGATEQAAEIFAKAGYNVVPLPVSHAFHTSIVAPASEPLRRTLERLHLQSPHVPVVANVSGEFYPMGPDVVPKMLDILARQVASPVQFVKGLRTLYDAGARVFVEVGPKKALQGFAEDVLGERGDVVSLFTNHPKNGDISAFNQALCGLYAAGLGRGVAEIVSNLETSAQASTSPKPAAPISISAPSLPTISRGTSGASTVIAPSAQSTADRYVELGRLFADTFERGWRLWQGQDGKPVTRPVVITGASLGLPGTERIFDDANIARILRGEQFIDVIPTRLRQAMLDKHIIRLVKSDKSGPTFETITNVADVVKLAGRGGAFDLEEEFGVSSERVAALDSTTRLAMAAGIDALHDAGIPLVMRYKTTTKGTLLPDRWGLPDALRDDTGVIFASAFPGYDSFADEMSRYYADRERRAQLVTLQDLFARLTETNGHSVLAQEIRHRVEELSAAIEKEPYVFERRFLFRALSMGHSQFAEFIGARGPNTQINAACASTTQAVSLAEDWIRAGRCRRVIVVSADNVTSDHLMEWMGAGFLASGAAATDDVIEEAAIPFDRRRHGLIVGMGAAAIVVESAEAAQERGIQAICEVLSAVTANSAFHGTRLDVQHIGQVMEDLVARAETLIGVSRQQIAPKTVFVSHETYTPARGGSASAEIFALRKVFGDAADQIVIANTKGFTGHAMGTGIEDVVAIKALETGWVPPVANFKEVDPELGALNLSKGGLYPVEYALRLGAGFGSQISMTLFHWLGAKAAARPNPNALGYATRIADPSAWSNWLGNIAGQPTPELEVVHHTLRVKDIGAGRQYLETVREPRRTSAPVASLTPAISVAQVTPTVAATKPEVTAPNIAARETQAATAVVAAVTPAPGAILKPQTEADPVKERVLALVAEKTGYPPDMLALDLDLEADLGVDTVKQAEVFAAIRGFYNIPRDENLKLRNFPTLAHVIRFVYDKRPDLAGTPPVAPAAEAKQEAKSVSGVGVPKLPVAEATKADPVRERILALVVEKTGYPSEMLDLDLDLEADLGIDTVKQAEMFAAIREIYNIPRDENRKLRDYPTLAHVIRFVYEKRPDLAAAPALPVAEPKLQVPTVSAGGIAVPASSDDVVKEKVLEIVAEKTGYPNDMLDLDLDLEADLGIDTVKQAEMFASVRAAFNIPRDENLKLRDFPTLAKVIQFAKDRLTGQASASSQPSFSTQLKSEGAKEHSAEAHASAAPAPITGAQPVPLAFDAANAIPRRAPVPNLRPPLNLCKPTGVTLSSGQRIVIMPEKNGVAEALVERLRSRSIETLLLEPTWDTETLAAHLKNWIRAGSVHGVYWLPALDFEGNFSALNLAAWHEALRVRVKSLYATMRTLYDHVGASGTFLVSGTRLGGHHGYDDAGALAPLGGAVVGFTKAFKRERTDALVKAVDFAAESKASETAELLIEETLRDPGAVEIGYKNGLRWTVGLEEKPAVDGNPGLVLDKDSVFLITGAAGSIVSAITADLAAASGGTFYLLDLVPEPKSDDPDLNRFATDRDNLKRDLFERIQARGERVTPVLVEKELAALERARAAQDAIDAVKASGGTAHYFSVNLTDAEAVAKVIDQVRQKSGCIDVLLHAAGIERSHFLPEKEPREFDLVFDVKCDGWFNLLRAIGDMPLGATVAFSSVAGRFGNAGQADYSAANDLLCKLTSNFRTTRPGTRAIVIDWTAWGGIGMATRGSIPKMMELAGIDMLPPEAGIPLIRRELVAGGTRGEIVIGQRLGILMNEWDANGGLDPKATEAFAEENGRSQGPMIGAITRTGLYNGLIMETKLDPAVQPFLHDHQIEGTPVLPGVMGVEAFAEAASWMLPSWHVAAVEEVTFLAPFKFYRNDARTLTVQAVFHPESDDIIAYCQLLGHRSLPNQPEPLVTTHFTGRVRMTKQPQPARHSEVLSVPATPAIESADIYRLYFHGPAYQVICQAWRDCDRIIGRMADNLPSNHCPPNKPLLMEPRWIELCFQTAGLWEMSTQGTLGLPQKIHRVSVLHSSKTPEGGLYAIVSPDANGGFDAEVVDRAGNLFLHLSGYRTVALPNRVDAEALKGLQAVAV